MIKNTMLMMCCFIMLSSVVSAQNKELITVFRQTEVTVSKEFQKCSRDRVLGNCVAIALIKCALGQYGSLENIFKEYTVQDDGIYTIVFHDDIKIEMSPAEIDLASELSGIKGNTESQYYQDARILYASICKRIFDNKELYDRRKCINSFKNAVEHLNSGFSTKNAHKLLGMGKENLSVQELEQNNNAIVWCSAHAAYVSNNVQDLLGKEVPVRNKKMRNLVRYSKIKGGYKLVKF